MAVHDLTLILTILKAGAEWWQCLHPLYVLTPTLICHSHSHCFPSLPLLAVAHKRRRSGSGNRGNCCWLLPLRSFVVLPCTFLHVSCLCAPVSFSWFFWRHIHLVHIRIYLRGHIYVCILQSVHTSSPLNASLCIVHVTVNDSFLYGCWWIFCQTGQFYYYL